MFYVILVYLILFCFFSILITFWVNLDGNLSVCLFVFFFSFHGNFDYFLGQFGRKSEVKFVGNQSESKKRIS